MTAFGRFLEMSRDDILLLGHLGLLQDIGKLKLPTALIEKRGRLTPIEFRLAQKHVEYSAEILRATPGLPPNLADLRRCITSAWTVAAINVDSKVKTSA
jgi:HD-GYP domain-containing protein (c-di-GMP phosphodiesterase class II)